MTTRAEVLKTIEKIELDLAETLKHPTLLQRFKILFSKKDSGYLDGRHSQDKSSA
jgi:hypothetical protein